MSQRILLVDDDALVLKSVKNLLALKHYEVNTCKSAQEAVETFKNGSFDLVICDIRMPEESGIFAIKQIRKHEASKGLKPTPVIVITGYASEDVPVEAIELGVEGYVLKPFDQEIFFAAIEKVLSKSSRGGFQSPVVEKLLAEIKGLVARFHDENERQIFQDKKLQEFIKKLEATLAKIEKEFVKLS